MTNIDNEDKDYAAIVADLQKTIDERKAADKLEAITQGASDTLTMLGYQGDNHASALEILTPLINGLETVEDAEAKALSLHHAVSGVASSKKSNSFFK